MATAAITRTARRTPRSFTTRNVGVEMEVTPTVEDDNSISLLLKPKVTEFEGFVEYGGTSVADTAPLIPGPGALAALAVAGLMGGRRRRRTG